MAWPRKPLEIFKSKPKRAYCTPKLGVIHTSLRPNALLTSCCMSNILPSSPGSTQSRSEKIARAQVSPSLKHTHTFILLSCLCITVSSWCRQIHSKMECQSKNGSIFQTIPKTCLISCIGLKPKYWSGFAARSCYLWWFFQNNQIQQDSDAIAISVAVISRLWPWRHVLEECHWRWQGNSFELCCQRHWKQHVRMICLHLLMMSSLWGL